MAQRPASPAAAVPATAPPESPRAPEASAAAAAAAAAAGPGVAATEASPRSTSLADAVRIAGGLSIAAGAIHAVAMVDHFDHYWLYGLFFLAVTYGQVLWGVALLRRPVSARFLLAGVAGNLAIVAVWLLSRTVGVPIGPEAGSPEPFGAMDIAVTIDQLVVCAYAVALTRPRVRAVRGIRVLLGPHRIRIAIALGSWSLFASMLGGHSH